jgi:uncharacterized protein (TIGR02001 family)
MDCSNGQGKASRHGRTGIACGTGAAASDGDEVHAHPINTNDLKNHNSGEAAMKKQFAVRSLVAATALAVVALSPAAHADAGFTGSLGVVSKYVLRGGTMVPENAGAAVQGAINFDTGAGVVLGWWGSSLDYTFSSDGSPQAAAGFENDLIATYSMEVAGMTLGFGATYYYYISVDDSDALEPFFSLGWGPFSFGAKYLAEDVIWGNTGDTYLTASYSQKLPSDFTFTALAGFYRYEDSGDFEAGLGTTESAGLKHIDLTLTHPLGKTGLDMSITYIIGGENRSGADLENTMVLGVSGAF